MKRKIIALVLAAAMVFTLCACNRKPGSETEPSPSGIYWLESRCEIMQGQGDGITTFYRYDAEKGIVSTSTDKKFPEDQTNVGNFETQDGRISKITGNDGNGETIYSYNSDGTLIAQYSSYAYSNMTIKSGEDYDKYGIRTKLYTTRITEEGEMTDGTNFIYNYTEFDENGRPTKAKVKVELLSGEEGGEVEGNWKWDENGNMIEEIMAGTVGGEYSAFKTVHEYDKFGNRVHTILYADEDVYQETYFTYIPAP